jgi:hypothetical protein
MDCPNASEIRILDNLGLAQHLKPESRFTVPAL